MRMTSGDGFLTLIVDQCDGDTMIGFEGVPWHTHGDLLARRMGQTVERAVADFVRDVIENRSVIAVLRRQRVITDIWITDDAAKDCTYLEPGETLELRYWDASQYEKASS